MLELAAGIQVSQSDVSEHKVNPGLVEGPVLAVDVLGWLSTERYVSPGNGRFRLLSPDGTTSAIRSIATSWSTFGTPLGEPLFSQGDR